MQNINANYITIKYTKQDLSLKCFTLTFVSYIFIKQALYFPFLLKTCFISDFRQNKGNKQVICHLSINTPTHRKNTMLIKIAI